MESPLEAVQFLANSANRVQVLTTLVGRRATRRELQNEVGASRSTVARILEAGETRGWVASEGSRYWLTPFGETMVTDFSSYLETVAGLYHLGEMVDHLPPPLRTLDCRYFRDAVVVEPTSEDPAAPFTRAFELFQRATEHRGLTHTSFPHFARVLADRVEEGHADSEHVIEKAFVDALQPDSDRAEIWASMSEWVWLYDGTVPISLHIIDGTVLVWLGATRDTVAGLLETENDTVLSWAESLYAEYRSRSEPFSGF